MIGSSKPYRPIAPWSPSLRPAGPSGAADRSSASAARRRRPAGRVAGWTSKCTGRWLGSSHRARQHPPICRLEDRSTTWYWGSGTSRRRMTTSPASSVPLRQLSRVGWRTRQKARQRNERATAGAGCARLREAQPAHGPRRHSRSRQVRSGPTAVGRERSRPIRSRAEDSPWCRRSYEVDGGLALRQSARTRRQSPDRRRCTSSRVQGPRRGGPSPGAGSS